MHQSFGIYSSSYLHTLPDVHCDPRGQMVEELLCVCVCTIKLKSETLDSIRKHNVLCVRPTVFQACVPPCLIVLGCDRVPLSQKNIFVFLFTFYLYLCSYLLQFCANMSCELTTLLMLTAQGKKKSQGLGNFRGRNSSASFQTSFSPGKVKFIKLLHTCRQKGSQCNTGEPWQYKSDSSNVIRQEPQKCQRST